MYSLGDDAANGLHAPAVGVVDVTSLPQNDGGDDPGPEELPEHTGPPRYLLDSLIQNCQLMSDLTIPSQYPSGSASAWESRGPQCQGYPKSCATCER